MALNRVTQRPDQVGALLDRLLDRRFDAIAQPVLAAIVRSTGGGALATRLDQLAQRTAAGGLTEDAPELRALLADLQTTLRTQAALVDGAAGALQQAGAQAAGQSTRQLAFIGLNGQQAARLAAQWNVPDPEAVARLVDFSGRDEWRTMLEGYQGAVYDRVRDAAILGIVNGQNPVAIARNLRQIATTMPVYVANSMMRTLQLEAYREATRIHQMENARLADGIIRIAALDDRTCLCCIALHGREYPVGTRIDDHDAGRCTSILKVKGRTYNVQTGEQWFNGLPDARRESIAGGAAFRAIQAGEVQLQDFVGERASLIYGRMMVQRSLRSVLGDGAQRFYQRNQEQTDEAT